MRYAGIGARKTPPRILRIMADSARELAKKGYSLSTGAAKGADQAFAEGAIGGYGRVDLYLPWSSYEKQWWRHLNGDVYTHILDTVSHKAAIQSVYKYHPAANRLSQGVLKLHARNFLVMENVDFVICWTPNGEVTGGTGQALRLAIDRGIRVYNLGNKSVLNAFAARLKEV